MCTIMKQKNNSIKHISYYQDNKLVIETNPSFGMLRFLYTHPIGKILKNFMTRRGICQLAGSYYNSKRSINKIAPFIKTYNIVMDDFQQPTGGYQSFNDFFTRALKPGTRHIDHDTNVITSPADAKVYVIPNISSDTLFFVKHKPFNLEKFLGDKKLADQYKDGTLIIFRLAPYDYHRFHFPADAIPSAPHVIRGAFQSVNPIVLKTGVQPLTENERQVVLLKTDNFDTIAMVAVGAMMVGKIVHTFTPNVAYKKGDQAGYFAFGGSTVVLLFKHGVIKPLPLFVQHSLEGFETAVKMGHVIGEKGAL